MIVVVVVDGSDGSGDAEDDYVGDVWMSLMMMMAMVWKTVVMMMMMMWKTVVIMVEILGRMSRGGGGID